MITFLLSTLILVIAGGTFLILKELRATRRSTNLQALLETLGFVMGRAHDDPKQLLLWAPFALSARRLFPEEFVELDRATGHAFPFDRRQIEAAHARWTAEWLSWERAHDEEYRLKAAKAEADIGHLGEATSIGRARVASIEREKLERYQQRYEEYVRVAKALTAIELPD